MSQQLISRSPDLKRLRDDGYDLEIRGSYLLVKDVPYLDSKCAVKRGILVSELTLAGDVTAPPSTHVVKFVGEYPCDRNGSELQQIGHGGREQLAEDLIADHSFSSKPAGGVGFQDYYGKMVAYVSILVSHAQAIDPDATAQTYPPIATEEHESVFKYLDTASSRAGINMASKKLEIGRVGIIGVGGTGSYVLDLVAKTPVKEIHLFDGDVFLSHNAFRSPGAVSLDELRARPTKVAYLARQYSKMRGGIVEHGSYIDASNVSELQGMDFVFLCIDAGTPKMLIVEHLELLGVPFVDVGMGGSFSTPPCGAF